MRSPSRQSGAVMTETVLVLPLILVVLALLFFLGSSMLRLQRATTAARSVAWRSVAHAPGPTTEGQVADAMLGGAVAGLQLESEPSFPPEAGRMWARAAAEEGGNEAGNLAEGLADAFPTGLESVLSVNHDSTMPLSNRMGGEITQRETVIGNNWKFVNGWRIDDGVWVQSGLGVTPANVIRDRVFIEFDRELAFYANAGNPVAETIRGFYLRYPAYRGPEVPYQWVGSGWGW